VRDLFQRDFKIVRLGARDAAGRSDHFSSLCELLVKNETAYPNIASWVKKKVVPGLISGERTAFVGYEHEKPVASAVLKCGSASKFCHLKLADNFQDLNLGEIFFTLMTFEARAFAKEIHFTLPESLWEERSSFFRSFGFLDARPAHIQYRLFEQELRCAAPFVDVWRAAQDKLSKLLEIFDHGGPKGQLLMSVQPSHAERILKGKKTVEIRKRFAEKWLGHRVSLYASKPVRSLVGEARISAITTDNPLSVWKKFGSSIGVPKAEFDRYVKGTSGVYAITLDQVIPYTSRVTMSQISDLVGHKLVPPQSYCSLHTGGAWAQAVSVATMMNQALATPGTKPSPV